MNYNYPNLRRCGRGRGVVTCFYVGDIFLLCPLAQSMPTYSNLKMNRASGEKWLKKRKGASVNYVNRRGERGALWREGLKKLGRGPKGQFFVKIQEKYSDKLAFTQRERHKQFSKFKPL